MGPRITTMAVGAGAVVAGGAIAFALAVGVGAVTLPSDGRQAAVAANFLSDSSSGTQGWGRGPGMHGGWGAGPLQALVADKTITAQQATAIMQAIRTQHEKTETSGGTQSPTTWQQDVKNALDSLVAAGTITSAQAAKVSTALATMPGPGFDGRGPGMHDGGMGGGMHGGWGVGPNGTNPGASPAPGTSGGTTS